MNAFTPSWLERIGRRQLSDSTADIALDDPQRVIWVGSGALDMFLRRTSVRGLERRPFARIESGASVWGMRLIDGWTLVGSPLSGSALYEVPRNKLLEQLPNEQDGVEIERQLTRWMELVNGFKLLQAFPGKSQTLRSGMELQAEIGTALVPQLPLLWLRLNAGSVDVPGGKQQDAPICLALTPNAWVQTGKDASGVTLSSHELAITGGLEAALDETLRCMADVFTLRLRLADRAEWQRLATRSAQDRVEVASVARTFRSIFDTSATPVEAENKSDALLAACRLVGRESQIEFAGRGGASLLAGTRDPVALIARAAGVRTRAVALRPGWWRGDHGPLLAFHGERCQPVALKPEGGGYTMIDPTTSGTTRVNAEVAEQIDPIAQSFYRTLGPHPVSVASLMQFVVRGNQRDLFLIVLLGLLSGLVGMAGPYLTAPLFDDAIPSADRSQALQVAIALLASVLAGVMFDVTRNLSVLRVEGQSDLVAEAAVWDRLLRLPVTFFRQYSVGDLALRVNSIGAIRRVLSGTTVNSALSGAFSLVSFGLLVHFDPNMAWLTAGMVALLLALMLPGTWLVLRYQREVAAVGGQLSGLVFQLLRGIAKLRTSAAEVRAYSRWATLFARQEKLLLKANLVSAQINIVVSVFPILASCALFFAVASAQRGHGLSTGAFLAFNAAFGSFLGGVLAIFQAIVQTLSAVPMYERAKPILEAATEGATGRADPGVLAGSVEVSGLSFRYAPDAPLVLQDVSVQIQPGQFVAFVGGSGSGKSTLLRLLLGFERPNLGSIFFDGQDLAGLDVTLVRRQMGVVLQNSQLMGGDIFSSVCGASTLTPSEVTQALHACGMEEDIAAMPMGVHTVLPEGGTTLSGGQRQRLLLARAVATRPRLLLLDEATSALDNRSQAIVTASLDALKVTRIVVAHRLSTIVHADRIYVFDAGRVVQSGSYAELIAQPGLFADLASRQQT